MVVSETGKRVIHAKGGAEEKDREREREGERENTMLPTFSNDAITLPLRFKAKWMDVFHVCTRIQEGVPAYSNDGSVENKRACSRR